MKKEIWGPRRMTEVRYRKVIERIIKGLLKSCRGANSPFSLLVAVRGFARSPTMSDLAAKAALSMVTAVARNSRKGWRDAAARGTKSRMIGRVLSRELRSRPEFWDIVQRNADLIKTIPDHLCDRATKAMAKGYEKGIRPEELMDDVLKVWPRLTEVEARRIARTETSKASTALTQVRAEEIGLDWYVWRTSEDERVRSSHQYMEGVLINWKDPPSPEKLTHQKDYGNYHAGNIFNCRCYPEPLISLDDVSWPHKVYRNGRIRYMTRAGFKRIAGGSAI